MTNVKQSSNLRGLSVVKLLYRQRWLALHVAEDDLDTQTRKIHNIT